MKESPLVIGKSWFREPWPWLLASGPFLVVVASLVSAWIAIKSSDSLVSDDYYREGVSASETIARSDMASALGLVARVRITAGAISVGLTAESPEYRPPGALRVTLLHPTRAGLDQTQLIQRGEFEYSGKLRLPASGHWLILIEDDVASWRMMASAMLPLSSELAIGESLPARARHP